MGDNSISKGLSCIVKRISNSFFLLEKTFQDNYIDSGCARRGVSGALFPKSALCGAEFPLKGFKLEN
jgi:hypothetical protein